MRNRPRHTLAALAVGATTVLLTAGPVAAADPTVTVEAGDTLTHIASRHGTTVDRLARDNRLTDPNRIFPGQRLVLASASPSAAAPPAPAAATAGAMTHTVARGETLTSIAARYGTSVGAIVAANGIANPRFILPGQRLIVGAAQPPAPAVATPSPAQAPAAAPSASAASTHVVVSGESLWQIAQHYGTTVAALAAENRIGDPRTIHAGMRLTIPSAPVASVSRFGLMPAAMRALVVQRGELGGAIQREAEAIGLPPALAMAVAWQESGWRPGLTSSAGAVGVMQILPSTGEWIASSILRAPVNVEDTASNIQAGVRLLKHYHDTYRGDRARLLAAYYQGQYAVDTHGIYRVSWPYIESVVALEKMFAT